jgi:hypothetical protein
VEGKEQGISQRVWEGKQHIEKQTAEGKQEGVNQRVWNINSIPREADC